MYQLSPMNWIYYLLFMIFLFFYLYLILFSLENFIFSVKLMKKI
uniref:ATP synthase F0 subunit 8 n=1 Tax=Tetranychus malaysiensis TaxID=1215688 RepID=A0A075XA32_TETML|nr:ATP synthase F0 subunit 8 [Tetranychus malaysiensis]AIH15670.1 ATP synthase F0 subunit 8 [Tetranychus malaysiensis]